MRSKREPGVQIKTQAQLAKMAEAGRAVASALHAAADAVAPGVTTADLDATGPVDEITERALTALRRFMR